MRKPERFALVLLLGFVAALSGCDKPDPQTANEAKIQTQGEACADQASYESLKMQIFESAKAVRTHGAAMLDSVAAASTVHMQFPVVKGRDQALNVTVCQGRLIIDLPPGASDAFNGERRLTADIDYAVQAAANGSRQVYQLSGAEPIIYRLAAIDLAAAPSVAAAKPGPSAPTAARAAPRPAAARAEATFPRIPPGTTMAPEPRLSSRGRPSFNCGTAHSRAERLICADERLAALDRVMASLYRRSLSRAGSDKQAMLRVTQGRFLARRAACGGAACIADSYRTRLDQIDEIMARR